MQRNSKKFLRQECIRESKTEMWRHSSVSKKSLLDINERIGYKEAAFIHNAVIFFSSEKKKGTGGNTLIDFPKKDFELIANKRRPK